MHRSAIVLFGLLVVSGPLKAADDPKAIIEKAVKAHGGEENLTKYKAMTMKGKGTLSAMGADIEFTMQMWVQIPNKVRTDLKLDIMGNKLNVVQVYDGKKGWASAMGNVMEAEGDDLEELKDEAFGSYIESLVPLLKDKQFKLEAAGETKVNDKPAVGVKITAKGHKDVTMFFDKESGLMVMSRKKARDFAKMEVESESFVSEYKDVNGIKQAMKLVVKHDGKKFLEGELSEVKVVEKLDDKIFSKPD
jgi:hypothetical protein